MAQSGAEAYRLGRTYEVMPIPIDPAYSVEVVAGPLTFIVESRWLTPERVIDHAAREGRLDAIDDVAGLDDEGPSLHVMGTATGLEYLRFDCFRNEPHYHYLHHHNSSNTVVRLDDVAVGHPVPWTVRTIRHRMADMLLHSGVPELADEVRRSWMQIEPAIDEVERLLTTTSSR